MDAKNSYLELMKNLHGTQKSSSPTELKSEFNEKYKQNHPAQVELLDFLQQWKTQHGISGKRKPLEREETIKEIQQVEPVNQRRRVVVRPRKLIDE